MIAAVQLTIPRQLLIFTATNMLELKTIKDEIIICDSGNDRIVKKQTKESFEDYKNVDLDYLTKIGSNGSGQDQFDKPYGVTITDDYVLVAETNNKRLNRRNLSDLSYSYHRAIGYHSSDLVTDMVVTPDKKWIFAILSGAAEIFKCRYSDLYVVDAAGPLIAPITLSNPQKISISPDGQFLLVSDTGNNQIVLINTSDLTFYNKTTGLGSNEFNSPYGSVYSRDGERIFICDTLNDRIQVRDSGLNFIASFGSSGSGDDNFDDPYDITITSDDKFLLIADKTNHRIVKYDAERYEFIAKTGSYGVGDGNFNSPRGISIDECDKYVVISDSDNYQIKKYELLNLFQDFKHIDEIGTTGTGNNNFDEPECCTLTRDNRYVFVGDTNNNRIVKRKRSDLIYVNEYSIGYEVKAITTTIDDEYLLVSANYKIYKIRISDYSIVNSIDVEASASSVCYGLAVSNCGTYFYAMNSSTGILTKRLISDLSIVDSIGEFGAGVDYFPGARHLVVSYDDVYLFFADRGAEIIQKRLCSDLSWVSSIDLDDDSTEYPYGLCITSDGKYLIISNQDLDRIEKRSILNGTLVSYIEETGSGDNSFNAPRGIICTWRQPSKVQDIDDPETDYFYDKLVKYLPEFVSINTLLTALLRGFETALLAAKQYINASTENALVNHRYSGNELKQYALEKYIFITDDEEDVETQYYIDINEGIHQARGTLVGLVNDLIRITDDENVEVEEVDTEQSGWWLDVSYPGINLDNDRYDNEATATWLGCIDQVSIKVLDSNKKYTEMQLRNLIERYLIPGHVTFNLKTEATILFYIAINDSTDDMDLSKYTP